MARSQEASRFAAFKAPSLFKFGYTNQERPTLESIRAILEETPNTLFLTISRWACCLVNDLAVNVLFDGVAPLDTIPADPESNPSNFRGAKMVESEPSRLRIFRGMRITLTKNENKRIGFVNGMGATVLGMDHGNLIVRTEENVRLVVHPIHDENLVLSFPVRPGYASTLHKVQGATLDHITVWLDTPNVPAAAYVAISRVQYDKDWRYVGKPFLHHFTPARF